MGFGIAVNLSAAFHTIRLALPAMRRRNWGRIINVSSIYGLIAT
jgi:3-hydroxybutyrate dehydrogenase